MKDSAQLVAHYTSFRVACEHILPTGQIRFGPLSSMNDPRENKERLIGVGWSGEELISTTARSVAVDALRQAYLEHSKVFCGTLDGKNDLHLTTKLCYGRPRMWAQYGDNHRGVCLLFDRSQLTKAIRSSLPEGAFMYEGPVEYDDHLKHVSASVNDFDYDFVSELGLEAAIKRQVDTYHRALYLRKDSDWIGESEYRWVIYRQQKGPEFVCIKEALEAVILGVDFPAVYEPAIAQLLGRAQSLHLEWDADKEDFYIRELSIEGTVLANLLARPRME